MRISVEDNVPRRASLVDAAGRVVEVVELPWDVDLPGVIVCRGRVFARLAALWFQEAAVFEAQDKPTAGIAPPDEPPPSRGPIRVSNRVVPAVAEPSMAGAVRDDRVEQAMRGG